MKKSLALFSLFFIFSCTIFSDPKTAGNFPVYGNWCGPNHPKEGTVPKAIDKTDLACKHHDFCYVSEGYFKEICDDNLIKELKDNGPSKNLAENKARKAILSYFNRSPKL